MAPTTRKRSEKKNKFEVANEDHLPGVVYIGHIPHGFYEKEIKQYFSQFGKVLEVKVSRSKKNGSAKGYAFVKFKYSAVAKTVAETCHNYLFFNKLLKCQYKPLSEVHPKTFVTYPLKPNLKKKRQHNSSKPDDRLQSSLSKSVKRQQGKLKKLKDLGLDLKLSDILDVPESKAKKSSEKSLSPENKTTTPSLSPEKKTTTPSLSPENKTTTPSLSAKKKMATPSLSAKKKTATPSLSPKKKTPTPRQLRKRTLAVKDAK